MSSIFSNEEKNKQKYILCDSARSNFGKTETLLSVIKILKRYYPLLMEKQNPEKDRWCHFQLPDHEVVVSTLGDPNSSQPTWMEDAAITGAKFIVTACRTSGSTVDMINKVAIKYGYDIIWFQNFHFEKLIFTNSQIIDIVRDREAQNIIDIILSL